MTASRTRRSRSFRDAVISAKLLPANNLARCATAGQVAHQGVEPEPALGAAPQPLVADLHPTPLDPAGGSSRERSVEVGKAQSGIGAQREIYPLQFPLLVGEDLLRGDGRPACCDRA